MSADKRKVTTDALETLGTIITDKEKRDAIHLAVEPVIAGEYLTPGQDVGLVDGIAHTYYGKPVGIVDPFLKGNVRKGERFWLVVYPRQITSLRHVWEHPDFPAAVEPEPANDNSELSESEQWIRDFARNVGLKYEVLMRGAENWVERGDYLSYGGLLEGEYVPETFWDHYQAVTGKAIKSGDRENFFSCSC